MNSISQFDNPYLAPQTLALPMASAAETIRREHLYTEASIKSLGNLYYLGAALLMLTAIAALIVGIDQLEKGSTQALSMSTLFAGLAVFQVALAGALRKFQPWARTGGGVLAGIGLLGFPLGTVIGIYILVLLFGKKATMVFSDPYKEIMAATPHMKYRYSKSAWRTLIFMLLFLSALLIYIFAT